jgi:hypothetical protein
VILTPALAERLLVDYDGAIFDEAKVAAFAEIMRAGHWGPSVMRFSADGALTDGQHRCRAVVRSGRSIEVQAARRHATLNPVAQGDTERPCAALVSDRSP